VRCMRRPPPIEQLLLGHDRSTCKSGSFAWARLHHARRMRGAQLAHGPFTDLGPGGMCPCASQGTPDPSYAPPPLRHAASKRQLAEWEDFAERADSYVDSVRRLAERLAIAGERGVRLLPAGSVSFYPIPKLRALQGLWKGLRGASGTAAPHAGTAGWKGGVARLHRRRRGAVQCSAVGRSTRVFVCVCVGGEVLAHWGKAAG
jgi:hypothetical protein